MLCEAGRPRVNASADRVWTESMPKNCVHIISNKTEYTYLSNTKNTIYIHQYINKRRIQNIMKVQGRGMAGIQASSRPA